MSSPRVRLTAAIEQAIVAYIRAGGFAEVAAEAAGVPRATFQRWLRQGEGAGAKPRLRAFVEAIRQAQAQARLGAEVTARNDKPLDWLRSGPGRETAEQTGWTGNARPATGKAAGALLLEAEVQTLVQTLLAALADYPEARAALATALEQPPTSRKR